MTPPIRLFVDGVRVADGSPDEDPTAPYAIDGLTVTWGRPTTVDQPDASTCQFTLEARTFWPDPDLFGQTVRLGRHIRLDAGDGWTVFLGYITDVVMTAGSDDPSTLVISVTADDLLADLNNRPAAMLARPKETVNDRFGATLAAARNDTPYDIDADIAGIMVKRLEADPGQTTMVAELLSNIAASVDGVLWSTEFDVDGVLMPALWLESPVKRAPLRRLEYVNPYVKIVDVAAAAGAIPIDPCVPDLDPLEWRQTMSDLVTGVALTYYIPDPGDASKDIDVTITVVDGAVESPARPWGVRRMTLDSQLTTPADAQTVAGKIIGRLGNASWRLNGVRVDPSTADVGDGTILWLISMRSRHGLPITISPLPAWAPPDSDTFAGYLEGGEITSIGGVWSTNLWLSLAQGGGISGRWVDLPNPRITSTWVYATAPAAGTYRWASGALVLTVALLDSTGADCTAELSAAAVGDIVLIESTGQSWHATITVNSGVVVDKVQYTVTDIVGVMPSVGTTALLTVSRAGEAYGPWRWKDIDPAITWADLAGVDGPAAGPEVP